MNVVIGFALGLAAGAPTSDPVAILSVAAMFSVGSGITGFLFEKMK